MEAINRVIAEIDSKFALSNKNKVAGENKNINTRLDGMVITLFK
jgi:hypothetical protein